MRCTIRARCRSLKWTGCSVSHVYAARGWCALNCRSIRHNNVLIKAGACGCGLLHPSSAFSTLGWAQRRRQRQERKPPAAEAAASVEDAARWAVWMKWSNETRCCAHDEFVRRACALAVSGLVRRAHWLLYVVTWHISRLDGSIRTWWFALPKIVLLALTIYLHTFYSVRVNY